MAAFAVRPLACMIADVGTPWRCAIISMVSPGATVTAVPPSQLHWPADAGLRGGGGACTDPVMSGAAAGPGVYEAMPLPPPAMPLVEATAVGRLEADGAGSWDVSTRATGAGCAGGTDA